MSPDTRINYLILTCVLAAAAVTYAIIALRGIRQRPWSRLTRRAIPGTVLCAALAVWLTILHLY
jgi:hypothetical protein